MYRAVAGVICIRPWAPACDDLPVAEARLGVDDRRDQRRVEPLLARLLADDVLVAQRQRDLAGPRGGTAARAAPTTSTSPAPAASRSTRRRRTDRRAARRGREGGAARCAGRGGDGPRAVAAWRAHGRSGASFARTPDSVGLQLLDAAVVADHVRRAARLLLLGELARGALVDGSWPRAAARSARTSSSATTAIVAS